MGVETRLDSGLLNIKIGGRFEFGVHNEFRDAVKLAESGVKKIIVDMSQTEYLDSSALGMLLVLRDKIGGDRNAVLLTGARAEVKKILEIANFDKLFTVA